MAARAGGDSSGFGTVAKVPNGATAALTRKAASAAGTGRYYNSIQMKQPLNPIPPLPRTPRIKRTGKVFPGGR